MFNLKVAICIYGQPRYLNNKHVKARLDSIVYSKYDVDVYIHTWNVKVCIGSEWNKFNCNVSDLFNTIDNTYAPRRILIDKEFKSFSLSESVITSIKSRPYYSDHNLISLSSHLYSFQTCLSLIDKEYDFVFVTRFDNLLNKFPVLNLLERGNLYYTNHYGGNFSDASFILSSDIIKNFKPYDDMEIVLPLCEVITSEKVKQMSFLSKWDSSKMLSTNLICSIVRSDFDEIGIL